MFKMLDMSYVIILFGLKVQCLCINQGFLLIDT